MTDDRHSNRFSTAMWNDLPFACGMMAVIGMACIFLLSSAVDSSVGARVYQSGESRPTYAGFGLLLIALPGVLAWSGLWSLSGWASGARTWSRAASASALVWVAIAFYSDIASYVAPALVVILGISGYAIGLSARNAYREAAQCPGTSWKAAAASEIAALLLSCGLFRVFFSTSDVTVGVVLDAAWFILLIVSLLPVFVIGSCIPCLWWGIRHPAGNTREGSIALVPALALLVVIPMMGYCSSRIRSFETESLPSFVEDLSRSVSPFPPSALERDRVITLVSPACVEVYNEYGDPSNMWRSDVTGGKWACIDARMPLRWKSGGDWGHAVVIHRLQYGIRLPQGQGIASRAGLEHALSELECTDAVTHARWQQLPPRGAVPQWTADAMVHGIELHMQMQADGRSAELIVRQRR